MERFLKAQEKDYSIALSEIQNGRKRSHWMWYIFPQIAGLGRSETAKFYAIKNRKEAEDYLLHPVLGARLREITDVLLALDKQNPITIFGSPDDLKLQSSMTLFAEIDKDATKIFEKALDKFFGGKKDQNTLALLD